MASGVKVANDVMEHYNKMKVDKKDDREFERIRLLELIIKDEKEIVVAQCKLQKDVEDMENKDVFKYLGNLLKDQCKSECRYFLYDCHYDTQESSNKKELVLVLWSPQDSKVKSKMIYASSANELKRALGFKHYIEAHDPADLTEEAFLKELGNNIRSFEGHACGCAAGKGH